MKICAENSLQPSPFPETQIAASLPLQASLEYLKAPMDYAQEKEKQWQSLVDQNSLNTAV